PSLADERLSKIEFRTAPVAVVGRVAEALNEQAKPFKGSRVLGAASKKDVDDPRESPAFEIRKLLRQHGAHVSSNDLPAMRHHATRPESRPLTAELLACQDCVVSVTDHSAREYDWVVRHGRAVADTRNATHGVEPGACRAWKA